MVTVVLLVKSLETWLETSHVVKACDFLFSINNKKNSHFIELYFLKKKKLEKTFSGATAAKNAKTFV